MNIEFHKLAPYLSDPLILIGFFLLLAFTFSRYLVKKGIIGPMPEAQGYRTLRLLLLCGFIIGLLITIFGFVLRHEALIKQNKTGEELRLQRVQRIAEELLASLDTSLKSPLADEQDEMLTKYDASLARDPYNVPTLILRGQWQYVKTTTNGGGGLRNALADFRKAAESDPNLADPHFGIGTIMLWLAVFDVVTRHRFEIRRKGELAIDPTTGLMRMVGPNLQLSLDDRPRSLLQTALDEFQQGLRLKQSYTLDRKTVVLFAPQDVEQRIRTTRVLLGHEPQLSSDQWLGRIFTEAYSRINPGAFAEVFEMRK